MSTRIECPNCAQTIEVVAPVDVSEGLREQARARAAGKILDRAGAVEKVSWFLFAMVLLCFVIALLSAGEGGARTPLICAGSFFTVGWMTNLVAQLLHIRAELTARA
jgi:surface polysaccharide O-acyltransferase-like enzyme